MTHTTGTLRVAVEQAAGKLGNRVSEDLLETLRKLSESLEEVRRIRVALRDFTDELEGAGNETALRARSAQLLTAIESAFGNVDVHRNRLTELIEQHVPVDKRPLLLANVVPQLDPAAQAIRTLILEFQTGFVARLAGERVLAKSVRGVSPRVLLAAASLYEQPHCSIDPQGAPNVEHMVSVFECVLRNVRNETGKLIKGDVVDSIFLETLATDVRGKGRSPTELANFDTVPILTMKGRKVGRTGGEIWSHALIRDLLSHWPAKRAKTGAPKRALVNSVRARIKPTDRDVERDLAGLRERGRIGSRDVRVAKEIWNAAVRDAPFSTSLYKRDFLAGTLVHGIGNLDDVFAMVLRAGGSKADARRVSECQLGHHMAGFVAFGFSQIDAIPDFDSLAASGLIRKSSAPRLERLYREAIALATTWRPRIDQASRRPGAPSLTHAERAEYAQAARELRRSVRALPSSVRWQLTNDDAGQFTPVGLSKWLNMFRAMPPGPSTLGELIMAVYSNAHQPYKEENEGRGTGEAFALRSAVAASRLGLTLVDNAVAVDPRVLTGGASNKAHRLAVGAISALAPDVDESRWVDWYAGQPASFYRAAVPGEPAFAALAARLRQDLQVRTQYREVCGTGRITDEHLVAWFRESAPDPALASRIARS